MLCDYKETQSIAYNLLMNEIVNNKISHAYLFDENNCNDSFNIVMAFIKEVLCYGLDEESKNTLCKRIDDGNYPEIKIIEPDGTIIKKQQLINLQQEFSQSAVEGHKRIYIIREADKMRIESANSMLKFLEEPDNDIMAILMTNNFNNLLSTIVSRCQVIRFNNDTDSQKDTELTNIVLKFIKYLENNGIRTIISEQELLFSNISLKDRNRIIDFFDKMIDMYYDILKIFYGSKEIIFSEYYNDLQEIADKNTVDKILNKMSILLEKKDTIKNNVNINLLIDSLIISIGGM